MSSPKRKVQEAEGGDGLLVLHNGRVVTMGPRTTEDGPLLEAIALKDGRVAAVGSRAEVERSVGASRSTRRIDLGGRLVVPGLIDSHLHFVREGLNFLMELRWDGVESLQEALSMLRDQAKRTPPGQWVRVVGGWCEFQFSEKRMPTLEEINEATGDVPAFILHLYDCALVNRAGLAALGYSRETQDPPASEIQRDAQGNPTGLLVARPNAFLLYNTLNRLPKLPLEQQVASTVAYQRDLNRFGVTSVLDPGGGFQNFPDDYRVIETLDREKKLSVRVNYSLFPQKPGKELEDFKRWAEMVRPGQGSDFYRHVGAGEMLAFSAADFEDFKEPRPELSAEMEQDMEAIVRFLVQKRWPFRLHATYGESIERELQVFEKVNAEIPFEGLRWFIDHAETISERDIARIHALGGGIAIQHRMAYQGEYFLRRYGEQMTRVAPPINKMLRSGVQVGAGTDGTRVASYNPFVSLYWLVTGATLGGMQMYDPSPQNGNTVSRHTALRLWTSSNTWFCSEEKSRGMLLPGYMADLAVLSEDYFTVPEERIKSIESVLTLVGGRIVFVGEPFRDTLVEDVPAELLTAAWPEWSPVRFYGGYQLRGSTAWPRQTSEQGAEDGPPKGSPPRDVRRKVQTPALVHSEFFGGHAC